MSFNIENIEAIFDISVFHNYIATEDTHSKSAQKLLGRDYNYGKHMKNGNGFC